jgi:hypothetical protein
MRHVRTLLGRIAASRWDTRVAVAIPLLLGMIALSVLLGAFASNAAPGGYGGPPTSKPTPSTR